ncbi:MAG: flagellar hook-associated protein FlgK [Gemmatimonadaceae bacterium]|nr:flagellar hook-associated protein FlgK [Gemmatimonadaceae bacterium]
MGLGGILSTARTAIAANQAAVQVASHNIANAETEGYSRQRAATEPLPEQRTPIGAIGTGIRVARLERMRDALIDQEFRDQSAPAAGDKASAELLGRVESVFAEPSELGLAAVLDQFWNSWSDLAGTPSNASAKTVVRQRADALVRTLNGAATQIADIRASTVARISDTVARVNALASQIAQINQQIVPAEAGRGPAGDLRDPRDRLIDELSKYVPVRVADRPDGANQVYIGTSSVVDGATPQSLSIAPGSPLTFRLGTSTERFRVTGGSLGTMMDAVNTTIPGITAQLDAIAAGIVQDVNTLHTVGWSPTAGATGVAFFDTGAGNNTAATIRLSAAVRASASAIATGPTPNAPGDNATALAISTLRMSAPSATSGNYGADYRDVISDLASRKSSADAGAKVGDTLVAKAGERRKSVSGVSVDEELVELIRYQQAYTAAAKIITTVDEMLDTLLSLKR